MEKPVTTPDFTCTCGRPVDVTRRVGGTVFIWHSCGTHSIGILATDEKHAIALWNAERQRRAA